MDQAQILDPFSAQRLANAQLGQLRIQIAANVLCQLAPIEFNRALRAASDERNIAPGDPDEPTRLTVNVGPVAQFALAFADGLLVAAGIAEQRG